ncbi:MAG TPA: methyltransferase domain-containing protein [Burkholderiaceae bacterium]|nr:methyltransferase domain-containing protein [Burkholderiaceae bacterium]
MDHDDAAMFERAKALFLDGVAQTEAGDAAAAEASFEASLALLPERASTLANLGTVRLALGKTDAALHALDRSVALDASQPDAWCQRGLALARLHRLPDSVASLERALAIDEAYRPALFHLGCLLNESRRHAQALQVFERLLALDDGSGAAWFRHGQTLQALGRPAQALASYERALALDAAQPQAWINRGGILREAGRAAEAAAAYRQALAHGGDAAMIAFCLAAVEPGQVTPGAPPPGHVQGLFDDYAQQFDSHLVQVLHYRGHQGLADELRQVAGERRFERALDLGCGTGLVGEQLRALAVRIDGVDLAANMLDAARAKGLYAQLVQADAATFLAATAERYDLVAAADVFTYLGALDAAFAGVARVLRAGGLFAFCCEVAEGDGEAGVVLRPSLRYAHSRAYLERLAREHGFAVLRLVQRPMREDQQVMLGAWYGVLSR